MKSVEASGRRGVRGALALLSVGVCAQASRAALVMTLSEPSFAIVTITDNGAGDSDPAAGSIVYSPVSGYGDFTTDIHIGQSNSPGDTTGLLQITSLDVRNLSAGAKTLTVTLSDTGFTNPGSNGELMLMQSAMAGTYTRSSAGDSVTFQSFVDPANGNPLLSTNFTTLQTAPLPPQSLTTNFTAPTQSLIFTHGPTPYSMANVTTITSSARGQVNFSGTSEAIAQSLTIVPEPASAFAIVLVALVLPRRKRASLNR